MRWLSFIGILPVVLAGAGAMAASGAEPLPVKEVAPGVYVHHGKVAAMTAESEGDVANIGFIVGDDCVAVIDTGGSPSVGRALDAAVAAHTGRPVCYVINTHAHPDHVLGNPAFDEKGVTFIAHEDYAQALGARMSTYQERFSAILDQPIGREDFVVPDRTVADTLTLDLGERTLELKA